MRVLILSVTAGHGHNNTARALENELRERGADVIVEDFYQQVSRLTYEFVDKGYQFSVTHMRALYRKAYTTLERNERMRKFVAVLGGNRRFAKIYAGKLDEYMPDMIIATHVFAAQMLNILKRQGYLKTPVIGVNTDYCIQPFWEEIKSIEYILTGSSLLSFVAIQKGIPEKMLLPLGLPIRPQFRETVPKAEARRRLELDENSKTILVMGGSMGYGNMVESVQTIDSAEYQIICVCGTNEKLRQQLNGLSLKAKLKVTGFIENVQLYMDASDCIITKPGGITVTEAMVKTLPMILTNPIPGHEERNAEFLVNNGAAIRVSKEFSLAEAVHYIFKNPERLALMRSSLELISHPDATERIADFVMEQAK